ncbi:hypothetical protein [Mycobacterium marinum]|uniref:hypothetical protein n=1 Tax=Mycobacterium marinum TaxID=1781 RepID=UPI000B96BDCE|nr:hypothetical protein [Mycobacterium marinum]
MTVRIVENDDGTQYIVHDTVPTWLRSCDHIPWGCGDYAANTEPVDIVDRIDELVNQQLANYPNRSGYDHNIDQNTCPHCGREWHGLKITRRIELMRATGRHYDETYRYAEDDSEVLCEGSEFIGPMKHPPLWTLPLFPWGYW